MSRIIFYLFLLTQTIPCLGQKNLIDLNISYVQGNASIKESWNVLNGRPGYKSVNGYNIGLQWSKKQKANTQSLLDNWSVLITFKNFGIEGPNSFPSIRQYERFSTLGLALNRKFKILKNTYLEGAPTINYLTSFNSFTSNSTGTYKHNNYFGQGFNSDKVSFNKLTLGASLGLNYVLGRTQLKLKWNPAFTPLAYINTLQLFKMYPSSFDLGISTSFIHF